MKLLLSLCVLSSSSGFAMGIGDNLCSELNQHYVDMNGPSQLASLGRTTLDDIVFNWSAGYVSALTDTGVTLPFSKIKAATEVEKLKAQCKSHPKMRLAEVILDELNLLAK